MRNPLPLQIGRRFSISAMTLGMALAACPTFSLAQATGTDPEVQMDMAPITISTTRNRQGKLAETPGSVQVIDSAELEQQSRVSSDMGEILSNLVPGLGQSSENLTNFGQQMRGRDFLVMIDGVPQNSSIRQTSKFVRTIAPEAVERVEVIRGAVANYGFGATGGIINFITKSGEGAEDTTFQSTVGVSGQEEDGNSLGGRVYQGVRGSRGDLDYSVNLSATETGVFYDGEDDIIPADGLIQGGSLSESTEHNAQSKIGYQLTPDQRLTLAVNYYKREQDSEYRADRASTAPAGKGPKITAINEEPPGKDPLTENLNISLDHTAENTLGGTLSSQLYYQDYETLFSFFNGYPTGGGQSQATVNRVGARVSHDRSVMGLANAVYGLDFEQEEGDQGLIDGRTRVPEIEETSYAPFVQLEIPAGDQWLFQAGVRHERVNMDIPTFQDETLPNPGTVQGGELDYEETLFNAGAIHFLTDQQEVFLNYSEGFTVADVGRALRGQPQDVSAEQVDPEAQVVKNYELGWRGRFDRLQASATVFMNTSDQGVTFSGPPNFELQQREERVHGLELTADYQLTDAVTLGGTGSYQEGRQDADSDGDLDTDLPGTRISNPEITAYAGYSPSSAWSVRAQVKHLFDRKELGDQGYPNGDVEGFTLVDLTGNVDVGPGELRLGISNLFDEQYIVPVSQAFNLNTRTVAGRGRAYSLEYSLTY